MVAGRQAVALAHVALTIISTCAGLATHNGYSKLISSELNLLATLKSRVTGSDSHNKLIDHIESELTQLGLRVQSEQWHFNYNAQPATPSKLTVDDQDVEISSPVPYSGNTGLDGVTGPLISVIGPGEPDWQKASGGIAIANITNAPSNPATLLPLWEGSPAFTSNWTGVPASAANTYMTNVTNLTDAAVAGVKGIVFVWEHISTDLAVGQYGPFWTDYFGIPAVYVAQDAAKAVINAAGAGKDATLTLPGSLTPNWTTRNIWAVIPGTELANESVIINTHTDGTNICEENGHIAMLAYARSLVRTPPKRTTILAFITAHIHSAPFSYATHRSTSKWLADNPSLWNASDLKAVFGSCVEHLGPKYWAENLTANTYTATERQNEEMLFAATPELAALTFQEWNGAIPGQTRVINPFGHGKPEQSGEGLPFLLNGIPEVSLVTSPSWLLKEWPENFDERTLIDVEAVESQIESFEKIWRSVDRMSTEEIGTLPVNTEK